jgi:hypothetical protein
MTEPKPFASLSPSLLARKGQAKPAMRPQAYHMPGAMPVVHDGHDDLGWNDMGDDVPHLRAVAAPVPLHGDPLPESAPPPPVVEQQVQLVREFTPTFVEPPVPVAAPVANPVVRAAAGSKGKAAFTLRLDGSRHFRLRLICAAVHRSAQQVVTQALDEYLARQPSNEELASYQKRQKSDSQTGDTA